MLLKSGIEIVKKKLNINLEISYFYINTRDLLKTHKVNTKNKYVFLKKTTFIINNNFTILLDDIMKALVPLN
ncbi:hypothetical protein BMS3Abin04_02227 [bacterium BMS3Abin04]|nr:hypothetical protein BMS3Abin04_02227 [bacterium BMS3Abin04]